jgi:hypothetical protein
MNCISKSLALILILIMTISSLSLLIVKPAFAQSIPTPLVPEFTVKFMGTFSIPLSGYSLPSVNITIKNQLFTPYTDQHGNKINLYYIIQWKENSSNSWQQDELPLPESNSDYTLLPLALIRSGLPPPSGQVDFQVEAVIGFTTYVQGSVPQGEYIPPTYTGEFSGWSNTQSIIVTSTPHSSSTSAYIPLSLTIYIAIAFVAFLLAGLVIVLWLLLFHMRKRETTNSNQ